MKILQKIKTIFTIFPVDGLELYFNTYYRRFSTCICEIIAILLFAVLGLGIAGGFSGLIVPCTYVFGQIEVLNFRAQNKKAEQ